MKVQVVFNFETENENEVRAVGNLVNALLSAAQREKTDGNEKENEKESEKQNTQNTKPASAKAKQYLLDLLEKQGYTRQQALEHIKQKTGKHIDELSQAECSSLIKVLGGGKS